MREFSTPSTTTRPVTGNLTDHVVRLARESGDAVRFERPVRAAEVRQSPGPTTRPILGPTMGPGPGAGADSGPDSWQDVTSADFLVEVSEVAKGLLAAGVEVGDRVALMSATRYEWTLLDYAIWFAGAVTVPVYESATRDHALGVLADSGATFLLAESAAHLDRLGLPRPGAESPSTSSPATDNPTPEAAVDPIAPSHPLRRTWVVDAADPHSAAIAELARAGADVADAELEARRRHAGPDDVATVVYTSGTTGRPKGCPLTHANLMAELDSVSGPLGELFGEDGSTLLFLPLAHILARVVQIGCVSSGVRLVHTSDVTHLGPRLREVRPTFLLAVPRVFERIFNTASQQATADGRGALFDRAAECAIAWSRATERGRVPLRLRARHATFERLVYSAMRESLGGELGVAVSGGAPLGERLAHFYRGIGIPVLEGYGLTETTAAITVNALGAHKIGTVGRPLPGAGVRVADDGELLVRGPQVFAGYWSSGVASDADHGSGGQANDVTGADTGDHTAPGLARVEDGWFATGDVGEVDDEGFVRISGRKNEILITAGGKVVAPTVLEDRLRAHPLVSQALVVGDRRPFVAALVTIDAEALPGWAALHGVPLGHRSTAADAPQPDVGQRAGLLEHPALLAEIQLAVDAANAGVSRAEAIRRFAVLPRDWSEERGQLTPSLKLKRNVVTRECREDIAAMYR